MIAQRLMAVVAAVFLIAAVAVATFGSHSISLVQAIDMLDHDLMERLPTWARRTFGDWAWLSMLEPLLARPAWFVPASAGLIFVGLSLSFGNRKTGHRSHRRS